MRLSSTSRRDTVLKSSSLATGLDLNSIISCNGRTRYLHFDWLLITLKYFKLNQYCTPSSIDRVVITATIVVKGLRGLMDRAAGLITAKKCPAEGCQTAMTTASFGDNGN